MSSTVLTPDTAGFTHLLSAAQKSRSVAAEGGYRDLLCDHNVAGIQVPGLDKWIGDDRTIALLADLVTGQRQITKSLWMNLAHMVQTSTSWDVSLAFRGVHMPEPMEAIAQFEQTAE